MAQEPTIINENWQPTDCDEAIRWRVLSSKKINVNSSIFNIQETMLQNPQTHSEEAFYQLKGNDWVNVFALNNNDELLVIEQFRAGCLEVTLETPGGIVDDGEQPNHAAVRELCEETGYHANHLDYLGVLSPNPAVNTNRVHYYLATDLQKKAQNLDANEIIQVKKIALRDFAMLVQKGSILHALVVAGFHFLTHFLNTQKK